MTEIRAFTDIGIEKFRKYLSEMKSSERIIIDDELLFDDNITYVVSAEVEIKPSMFYSKMEAAEYLFEIIQKINIEEKFYNIGLWSWLAAYYFDSVCPQTVQGQRKIEMNTAIF